MDSFIVTKQAALASRSLLRYFFDLFDAAQKARMIKGIRMNHGIVIEIPNTTANTVSKTIPAITYRQPLPNVSISPAPF